MKNILVKSDLMGGVLFDIQRERERQEILLIQGKFPWSCDNVSIPDVSKLAVLTEGFGEAVKEVCQIQEQYDRIAILRPGENSRDVLALCSTIDAKRLKLRTELVQVAAVAVAWCEALDRLLDRKELARQTESEKAPWCTVCLEVRTRTLVCEKCTALGH